MLSCKIDRFEGRSLNVSYNYIYNSYRKLALAIISFNRNDEKFIKSEWCKTLSDLADLDYDILLKDSKKNFYVKKRKVNFDEEIIIASIKMVQETKSWAKTSRAYNVSEQTLKRWFDLYSDYVKKGEPLPVIKRYNEEEKKEIVRRHLESGVTYVTGAKNYNLTPTGLRLLTEKYKGEING